MNKMLVAVFGTESAAYEGLSALNDLDRSGDITLYATAVVARDSDGGVSTKKEADRGPVGAAVGALGGGLVGLLAGPVGAAVGVSTGAITGMFVDLGKSGIDAGFLDEVTKTLSPGKVAVLADLHETWETPVDTRLGGLGAVVSRRLRHEVVEEQLARESAAFHAQMRQLKEELAESNAQTRTAVQNEIEAVRQKVMATQALVRARAEQAESEVNAKIDALRIQVTQAGVRQRARVEKRIAEVKADYAVRSAKLEQARKLVAEALSLQRH